MRGLGLSQKMITCSDEQASLLIARLLRFFGLPIESSRTRHLYFQKFIPAGIVDGLAQSLGRRME